MAKFTLLNKFSTTVENSYSSDTLKHFISIAWSELFFNLLFIIYKHMVTSHYQTILLAKGCDLVNCMF